MNTDIFEPIDYLLSRGVYLFSGPSSSGKTHKVCDILTNYQERCEGDYPKLLIIVYRQFQDIYTKVAQCFPKTCKIKFLSYLSPDLGNPHTYPTNGRTVVWLDDAQQLVTSQLARPILIDLATVLSHHSNISVFICLQ